MEKPQVNRVVGKAKEAMSELAAALGMQVVYQGGRYGRDALSVKFEFQEMTTSADGASDAVPAAFARTAQMLGVPTDSFGKTFKQGRRTYTVVGLSTRRPKFPVSATRDDGKQFKFPKHVLNRVAV